MRFFLAYKTPPQTTYFRVLPKTKKFPAIKLGSNRKSFNFFKFSLYIRGENVFNKQNNKTYFLLHMNCSNKIINFTARIILIALFNHSLAPLMRGAGFQRKTEGFNKKTSPRSINFEIKSGCFIRVFPNTEDNQQRQL